GKARAQLAKVLGHALDEIRVEQELLLDLLDRVAVLHQLADEVDPADRLRRVHAERALVLALAPHASRARQESLLDVLAKARLAELDVAAGEGVDDLHRGEPLGISGLDRAQLLFT